MNFDGNDRSDNRIAEAHSCIANNITHSSTENRKRTFSTLATVKESSVVWALDDEDSTADLDRLIAGLPDELSDDESLAELVRLIESIPEEEFYTHSVQDHSPNRTAINGSTTSHWALSSEWPWALFSCD